MLKIKKQYKQPDGTVLEIEGSEAEIEAYEKKQSKKNESAQRKRDILHGKKAKNIDMEELKRFLAMEIQKLTAIRQVNHWYFNNGWWWRPWWFNGEMTYIYSQTQPSYEFNGLTDMFSTTNSIDQLGNRIGLSTNDISQKNAAVISVGGTITTTTNTIDVLKPQWNVAPVNSAQGQYTIDCNSLSDQDITSVLSNFGSVVN